MGDILFLNHWGQASLLLIQPGKVKFHYLKKTLREKDPTISGCCHDLAPLPSVILGLQTKSSIVFKVSGKIKNNNNNNQKTR